jgi:hypothetical protein
MQQPTNFYSFVLLPGVGLCLLLFFVIVIIRPSLAGWATTTQRFSGFGVTVEIAAITIVPLLGVALLTVGVWLDVIQSNQDVAQKLDELAKVRTRLEEMEAVVKAKLRSMDFSPAIELDDAPDDIKAEQLTFEYQLYNAEKQQGGGVRSSMGRPDLFEVTIPGINPMDIVKNIQITDTANGGIWHYEGSFGVLAPIIKLRRLTRKSSSMPASSESVSVPRADTSPR